MSYPDIEYYITFLFEQLDHFKASNHAPRPESHGRPKSYRDDCLIVLFAILTLKGIHRFKAQHRWLNLHPQWACRLKLACVPSRATLCRRYKQLACQLAAFIEYLGDVGMTLIPDSSPEVVYQDKSLFKAKGVRAIDTDASWSKSHYHGWVYGYGLHLTVSIEGVPRMSAVDTACVNEKAVLDRQLDTLLEQNIGYLW